MSDYYDEIILDMDDHIHWIAREEQNFLKDHNDINTFIIINENPDKQIDFTKCSYNSTIKKFDNIFTADIINEYVSIKSHIIHLYGTVGYSADTEDVEFIYDKTANKIYVHNNYRLLGCDFEYTLFKDSYNICYEKYWTLENKLGLNKLLEKNLDEKYEIIETDSIPYYRYPRTKDGLSIPRIIYNVFKVFSDPNIPQEDKPEIIIPQYFYYNKRLAK
jgi:hypothetical protein